MTFRTATGLVPESWNELPADPDAGQQQKNCLPDRYGNVTVTKQGVSDTSADYDGNTAKHENTQFSGNGHRFQSPVNIDLFLL
jgi:hypothetical protein